MDVKGKDNGWVGGDEMSDCVANWWGSLLAGALVGRMALLTTILGRADFGEAIRRGRFCT